MRVISGIYKGRKLNGYDIDGTRPTMDRVKESMFAMIQLDIKNAIVLDLFAGSGSLGIEALSNGARECHFVEKNKEMAEILKKNLIGINNTYVYKEDYGNFLTKTNLKFDVILLDPPYNGTMISDSLKLIKKQDILNNEGIIVCEYETEEIKTDFKIVKERQFGNKKVMILSKN